MVFLQAAIAKKGVGLAKKGLSKVGIGKSKSGHKRRRKSPIQRLLRAKIEGRIMREKIKVINAVR